ncbi:hypothetical protein [Nostoc commune]|uniref:hypothetical protein n=1 Tax=Nostoc commune TaxID=1178 RepID=UPI0018C7CF04|nr:hypothetical protein [Nostoc commune]
MFRTSDRNASKKSHKLGKSWHLSSIYMDLRPSSSSIRRCDRLQSLTERNQTQNQRN